MIHNSAHINVSFWKSSDPKVRINYRDVFPSAEESMRISCTMFQFVIFVIFNPKVFYY